MVNSTDISRSLAEFLQSKPPGSKQEVDDAITVHEAVYGRGERLHKTQHMFVNVQTIWLHCDHPDCDGRQKFDAAPANKFRDSSLIELDDSGNVFARFICRTCGISEKYFALQFEPTQQAEEIYAQQKEEFQKRAEAKDDQSWTTKPLPATCFKYGELPPFGPRTPSKLLSLLRPEHETFIKGRRSESQGLGVGALAYYRRIVELRWRALVAEIEKIAASSGSPDHVIVAIRRAGNDQRFSAAVESINDALPAALFINGHNPLRLLHNALSEGIHNLSDEKCLELASHIRVVLVELTERISQAINHRQDLEAAVKALHNVRPRKD
jgi:hypothetical protein